MKCLITIEDLPDDGSDKNHVRVVLEFDPPITDDTKGTVASTLALKIIEELSDFKDE